MNLDKNPLTGLLAVQTNEESVRKSIHALVLTGRRERFNQPLVGSNLKQLLFDPIDEITTDAIRATITDTIKNDEPRAQMVGVEVIPQESLNSYRVNVVFSLRNLPQQYSFNVILKRVR